MQQATQAEQFLTRQKRVQSEEAEFRRKQRILEDCRDLRDDVVSVIRNSGLSYELIHARFGPHPSTLLNWELKRVDMPRMGKMRSALRACGRDLGIIDRK